MPPIIFVIVLSGINSVALLLYGTDNLVRLSIVVLATIVSGGAVCYCVLEKEEKNFVKKLIKKNYDTKGNTLLLVRTQSVTTAC